ncbi:MAG: squalene--hopene cyclase [Verrucomicrobiota bacterium]
MSARHPTQQNSVTGTSKGAPEIAKTGRIQETVRLAQQNLLRLQNTDGHWAGELKVDSTLCSDYILYMHWADSVDPVLEEKCVAHIRRRQLSDGGWNIYYEGPSEINATIKAYFALKLAGCPAQAPWMQEARATALRLGGIPAMNTYAKLYLALLGQFSWDSLPTIPAEIVLLPSWCPFFNLYEMSSWSRAMIVPLAILNHLKPTRQVPPEKQLHELYPAGTEGDDFTPHKDHRLLTWRNFFLRADRALKWAHNVNWNPLRKRALAKALKWMTERMGEGSDGLAAVFPAMLNSIIALQALGHEKSSPILAKAIRDFEGLFVDDPQDFRIQPCLSPIWDTAINIIALVESGVDASHPGFSSVKLAAQWLADREVRIRGDWAIKNPHPVASGWAFEYRNDFYPDTDDTMMVLMALRFAPPGGNAAVLKQIFERALPWLLSFQCKDGGWAAFDKDVTQHWLEDIPFADHNAIIDPTCSDLTGRMLELLGYIGFDPLTPVVRRAVAHIRRTQEQDGSWYGRWGVNYVYGTWQILRGLRAIGEPMDQDWIVRARDWLESCQNEDGGWGESPATYDDPSLKGCGDSTPSQTAWAIMGLCACNDLDRKSIRRAVDYLIRTQNGDGSWDEPHTTGTGFPSVFYLSYDMYRNNFPLMALATYANYQAGKFHQESQFRCA